MHKCLHERDFKKTGLQLPAAGMRLVGKERRNNYYL